MNKIDIIIVRMSDNSVTEIQNVKGGSVSIHRGEMKLYVINIYNEERWYDLPVDAMVVFV